MVTVEISVGELFDKLSILNIKLSKISDVNKLHDIRVEKNHLDSFVDDYVSIVSDVYSKLCEINNLIWDVEDRIREKEKCLDFDDEFIDLARSIYKMNDQRFLYKNEINVLTKSSFKEQKSYGGLA